MKKSFADILAEKERDNLGRIVSKVPEWEGISGLTFPTSLSIQQCSSSVTARYKAALAASHFPSRPVIADLTGGLGVDSWHLSQIAEKIFYNEMNVDLAEAVRHNFEILGASNIHISKEEITQDNLGGLLDQWKPDLVYLDPARRSASGSKVFRLADCSPDLTTLKDIILSRVSHLMVKLSPMADISQISRELGGLSEVHILGSEGECKELLVIIDGAMKEPVIKVVDGEGSFQFTRQEENSATPSFIQSEQDIQGYLFEPGKALMKSGAFNLVGTRYGLKKLGISAHLYVGSEPSEELASLGKWFRINDVSSLDKKTLAETGKTYPHCEVTARNLPMSSDEMRKKMRAASGDDAHIFGVGTEKAGRVIIITSRL